MERKVCFFSNHKDTSFLETYFNCSIEVIPHPFLEPEMDETCILTTYKNLLDKAINADELIINGDYFIVAWILKNRFLQGKKTGFICMKKFTDSFTEKDAEGKIIHKNILKPCGIRWIE